MTVYPPPEPVDPNSAPGYPAMVPPGQTPAWPPPVGQSGSTAPNPRINRTNGIIPLRPLGLGEILDGAVRAMRHNPKVMFGLSVTVGLVSAVSNSFFQLLGLNNLMKSLSVTESVQFETADIVQVLGQALGSFLIPTLITVLSLIILTGMLTLSIADSVIGAKSGISELFPRITWPGVFRLVGLSLVQAIIMLLIFAIFAGPVVALAFWKPIVAAIVGVFSFFLLLIAAAYVYTMMLFASPALLLERLTIRRSLARSWRLVKSNFWRIFGISLLSGLIASAVSALIQAPFSGVGVFIASAGATTSTDLTTAQIVSTVISALGAALATTVTTPFSTGITALLYIDTRIRREGLDIALARAAENQQSA